MDLANHVARCFIRGVVSLYYGIHVYIKQYNRTLKTHGVRAN